MEAKGDRIVEKPFTTAFVRPDRFRFEFNELRPGFDPFRRYIVRSNGKEVRTLRDSRVGREKADSLDMALGTATGVSSGSSHTVPALLLPKDNLAWRLTDMTETRRIEDAALDKADCFRIEGTFVEIPGTLWIDKKTFLLKRIDSRSEFRDFHAEKTTTYDSMINEEIPDEMLEFDAGRQ